MTPVETIRAALLDWQQPDCVRTNTLKKDPEHELVLKMDRIVKAFGLTWEEFDGSYWHETDDDAFQWDGKRQVLRATSIENILHELAHYQIASPKRRLLRGFGLGMEPDGGYAAGIMAGNYEMREESRASLLGILWVHHIGGEWLKNLNDHSWTSDSFTKESGERDETFDESVAWLTKHGMLVDGGPQIGAIRTHPDHWRHLTR